MGNRVKVLVTGGSGFIGSHVVRRLLRAGNTPVIYDRHVRKPPEGAEQILGDIRDAVAVTEAVAHVDAVIHLAGVLGTQETIANPRPAAETNVLGALNVFEAVAQYGLPCVNIAVGNHWETNTYSISKSCAERFAAMFNAERETTITTVRAFNAYGPGQALPAPWGPSKVRKIIPTFMAQALTGVPIEVYGDGRQVMDMIHVDDVASTLIASIGFETDCIVEAGSGLPTTVNEIAQAVLDEVGGGEVTYLPGRPGETPQARVLASQPLRTRISLRHGLAETAEYFRGVLDGAGDSQGRTPLLVRSP